MWEVILRTLEIWGAPAEWITAIVQLLFWVIGAPICYRRYRRRVRELQQAVEEQQEEIAKVKDLANAWFQMTKQAVSMMKGGARKVYRDYVDSYGGEQNFTDWWVVPEIPGSERKSLEGESDKTGG